MTVEQYNAPIIAAYTETLLHHTGTSHWIEAQQELTNLRGQQAFAAMGDDPSNVPQQYFDLVEIAYQSNERLVNGCVALARRYSVRDAIHQIRAAQITDIDEHLLLDAVTSAIY